ncbi:TA system VapC family ribonuclease toxin [Xylophilus sp.]|uniref:TA system VapC family ribonuclease toxin n=1 Tax=Xylophilus sp. TaxID=2653893 RepID=UPI0013B663BA|nr:TA system VapC family ribonuclease toxin [Xylophilus sp.]KAF1047388.1 MAG: Ribonuclease VapC25 [Xylophilus sp.]
MTTPDVNVLVAASRGDHPHHAPARAWLEQAVEQAGQGAPLRLQPLVVASFLRLGVNPRIFPEPTPMVDALRFVDTVLDAEGVELAVLGAEWPVLRSLCAQLALRAADVPDVWLAAAVLQQGE